MITQPLPSPSTPLPQTPSPTQQNNVNQQPLPPLLPPPQTGSPEPLSSKKVEQLKFDQPWQNAALIILKIALSILCPVFMFVFVGKFFYDLYLENKKKSNQPNIVSTQPIQS